MPLYFLLGVWGGGNRGRATLKFIIYTSVGTLLMLIGILTLGLGVPGGPSFSYSDVAGWTEDWIFLTFILAFFIKCPGLTVPRLGARRLPHGDARGRRRPLGPCVQGRRLRAHRHRAAIPGPSADWRWPLIALATTGLLYGFYLAFRQPDSRGVIAYSSIGQMGLRIHVLGIFVLNDRGATGPPSRW